MKKTNRITALLLAFITICIVAMTGCHGTTELIGFEVPETFDETKKYEISFWAKNDTNMNQVDIYRKAVDDFRKLYPNITVNLKLYTDYGRIYQDVITNIATNTTPNVCVTYPDHIATYLKGENTVVPLDSLMADKKYGLGGSELKFDAPLKEEIVPKFLEEGKIGNVQYALPFMRSTEACYINKTYVEKLGFTIPEVITWDFMWEVAEAATKKDENGNYLINGQKVMIPIIYKSTDNMMIQKLAQTESGYSTDKGEIFIFNEETAAFLKEISEHAKTGAFSTFKISSYPANFLNAGQCIFAIDSTAGATWMGSDAPLVDIAEEALVDFETVVKIIPQENPEDPKMISQGPSVCVFNKDDPDEVLASWLFTQFLLTNDVQIAYSQTEGYCPVTLKAQKTPEYIDYLSHEGDDSEMYYDIKLKATRLLIDNIDNTFVTPVFSGSASLRDASGQMIENVTKAVKRKQTVDDAFIEKLYAEMTSLYKLDQVGASSEAKPELGEMPVESIILICAIGFAWVCIVGYVVYGKIKRKNN